MYSFPSDDYGDYDEETNEETNEETDDDHPSLSASERNPSMARGAMRTRLISFMLVVLPVGWWAIDVHRNACGVHGQAWMECR